MTYRLILFLLFSLSSTTHFLYGQFDLQVKIPTEDLEGTVLLGLYNGPDLYLEEEGMIRHCVEEVSSAYTICFLKDLPAGNYSMAMLIDLNDNKAMDFNFIGWPKESYGFYPDPGFLLRKPKFKECNFELSGDMTVEMRVR